MPRRVHRPRPLRGARRPTAGSTTTRRWRSTPRWRSPRPTPASHVVGPSGMMDGQVGVDPRRAGRRRAHRRRRSSPTRRSTPRRSTARSARPSSRRSQGDRRTYQQDPANAREACARRCWTSTEGADIVMVKPALGYLDVVRRGPRRGRRAGGGLQRLRRVRRWSRPPRRTAGSTASAAILETLHLDPPGRRRRRADLLGRRGRAAPPRPLRTSTVLRKPVVGGGPLGPSRNQSTTLPVGLETLKAPGRICRPVVEEGDRGGDSKTASGGISSTATVLPPQPPGGVHVPVVEEAR